MTIFDKLVELFNRGKAHYRILEHPSEGRSADIARLRGTSPSQAAKAIVCELKGGTVHYALVVIPGDRRVDFQAVATHFGANKARFASRADAESLSECVIGAIPPISFSEEMFLVVDASLLATEDEIAFNAGRLDRSIVINTADYIRLVVPDVASLVEM